MRIISITLALLPIVVAAQTVWQVNVGGSTLNPQNLPYYSPQNITIVVGDTVRWSNQSGTHNVNGNLSIFPSNPEGFSSGNSQSGSWTYKRKFNIPGVYNYHCTSDGHAATQFGSVTVIDPTNGVAEVSEGAADIRVYPSPASDRITVDLGTINAQSVRVIDLNGAVRMSMGASKGLLSLGLGELAAANYFVLITDERGSVIARPFAKQ
ncbi:MAG: hypothetical protein IPJ85_04010 [Flavobacteriales bacterium]|nr:hypothetical protein [Flavobacteriales bacterium]